MQKPGGFPRRAECKYIPSDVKIDANRVVLRLPVIPDIMPCAWFVQDLDETRPPYCRFTSLSNLLIARSAALTASARLKASPVLRVRSPRSNDHFQPNGLMV